MNSLDDLWFDLLSGDAPSIQRAWASLDEAERQAVLAHLLRMQDEPDWHPSQRESAAAALKTIRDLTPPPPTPMDLSRHGRARQE